MMEQLTLIDKVRKVAIADERISAVIMYGSFTQGGGDEFSDIEFYIFLSEGYTVERKEWIASVHPIELFFTNEFGTDVVVFDNLIRGEFHFHSIEEVEVVYSWQGFLDFTVLDKMNLVDKDGKLAEVLGNIKQIRPEWNTPDNVAFVADSMINNLIFTQNIIRRGEYARAEQNFFFLKKYVVLLIRLHLHSTEHWLDPMKDLEKDIPSEWLERYRQCVPSLEPESLRNSFNETVLLVSELFNKLNVPAQHKQILEKIMK